MDETSEGPSRERQTVIIGKIRQIREEVGEWPASGDHQSIALHEIEHRLRAVDYWLTYYRTMQELGDG